MIIEVLRDIPDDFLRMGEVCRMLRVSRQTVHGWIRAGILEAQIIENPSRRSYRVTRQGLIRFLVRTLPDETRLGGIR